MTETYTFSRALHMMRYGGKKMRPLEEDYYYFVRDDVLFIVNKDYEYGVQASYLDSSEVMWSWIEVKDA